MVELPAERALLFPLLVAFITESDTQFDTNLRHRLKSDMDKVDELQLRLSKPIQNDSFNTDQLREFRIHSDAFDVTFPENNILATNPGRNKIVADGFWAFIKES